LSHIVTIQTQIRDAAAVEAACRRLNLPPPVQGRAQLFATAVDGLTVQLPGWIYPVVCQLESGELKYDNYGGAWGEQQALDRWLQAYAVEKSRLEARKQGHTVTEQPLADGSIRLTVHVSGGAA
jgi:hypothetical protein